MENTVFLSGIMREIKEEKIFESLSTFSGIGFAEKYLRDHGYSIGSMQRNEPIAIVKNTNEFFDAFDCQDGVVRRFLPKWKYVTENDIKLLDGVILAMPDFREGGARVLFFHSYNNE